MEFNSRLFDRIRIKPSCDEPREAAGPLCEREGCGQPGDHRAPKGRGREGQYWRFCLAHVREYNANYNYFVGMSDDAVAAFQKDAVVGHRPTWAMGVNKVGRERGAPSPQPRDWAFSDPLGVMRGEGVGEAPRRRAEPPAPRYSGPVRKALDVLGLDEGADSATIRSTYKSLVKKFHPDAHGGDRSFEDRLRDIIKAHDTLKAAGLC